MIEQFLQYDKLQLLNVPCGKPIYDEVLVSDCYRREQVPRNAIVMDIGGFYGEFGIWCAVYRDCHVKIFEPSPVWQIARFNVLANNCGAEVIHAAVGRDRGFRELTHLPDKPYGTRFSSIGKEYPPPAGEVQVTLQVKCLTLKEQIESAKAEVDEPVPIVIKMDCEGGEQEIFEEESWLDQVHLVLMEFHYRDGRTYSSILERHGFEVDMNDPNPQAWRATIYAKRK